MTPRAKRTEAPRFSKGQVNRAGVFLLGLRERVRVEGMEEGKLSASELLTIGVGAAIVGLAKRQERESR